MSGSVGVFFSRAHDVTSCSADEEEHTPAAEGTRDDEDEDEEIDLDAIFYEEVDVGEDGEVAV